LFPDPQQKQVLTVRQLNEEISAAVGRAFPATVWVRGEVQRLPSDAARRQHIYFELHETGASGAAEYQASVSLMGWDRQKYGLGRYLDGTDPDLQLANKLEVCLECRVDFYAKFGKLSLKVVGVDPTFSLGRLEALRRATVSFLQQNGLLELQRELHLPDLPLRVGLITAPGSAAEQDFLTGLDASPWGFVVTMRGAKMQGEQTERQIIAALEELENAALDVLVITRGGGSRADLSWFDQKALAEKIARSPIPVITAIGHEIDRSIADEVAHRSCKTPTAAAEFLVEVVEESAFRLEDAVRRLAEIASERLAAARRRIEVEQRIVHAVRSRRLRARLQVQSLAGGLQTLRARRVAQASEGLVRSGMRLAAAVRSLRERQSRRLTDLARRIGREAPRGIEDRRVLLRHLQQQARLQDPARLLDRGYSLTLSQAGSLLRNAADVAPGEVITTRLAAGELQSIVQSGPPAQPLRKPRKRKPRSTSRPGQDSLFD
jgi:exodeoxyribonuclease VII large subunit